jgi:integrase
VSGRSLVRSVTVHGDRDDATAALARWAATAQTVRAGRSAAPGITVGDLLTRWLTAPHSWRPSTFAGYTSTVRALRADPLGHRRATALSPQVLRCAMAAWTSDGVGPPTVAGRVRCLRSSLAWAYREGILDSPPLRGMRGPAVGSTRLHAPVDSVRAILRTAADDVITARDQLLRLGLDDPRRRRAVRELHKAEQVLLLARLAADSGARRGELAALQIGDLDGDVLTISRGTSHEVVGPTKTGRIRRLTLGRATAELWHSSVASWHAQPSGQGPAGFGPWLFSRSAEHDIRLTTSCAGHWFADLAHRAGRGDVTLHRLRHTVATVLVGQGDILQAQQRLGHRDASTTLRIYSHALPLTDSDAAARLDELYR